MQPIAGNETWSEHSIDRQEPRTLSVPGLRLMHKLDAGGMGSVWRAHHLERGVDVAVKFAHRAEDPTLRKRLEREARLASQVDHPNAVQIHEHGFTESGVPYLAMELLEGRALRDLLDQDGAMSRADAVDLVRQVAAALDAVHGNDIIHRDVKPANLFVVQERPTLEVKLIDFGVAKPRETVSTTLTRVGQIVGTPLYITPEQLLYDRPVDHRVDLWGLALVAYEVLLGQRAFSGDTITTVAVNVILRRFEPASAVDGSHAGKVDAFFERALHAEPGARFQTAGDLATAFAEAVLSNEASQSRRAPLLRLPERLYGRDEELRQLQNAYDSAAKGRSRAVLVAGYSGTGKSALVHHIRRQLAGLGASVASGKFDAFDRGTPYKSIIQSLRQLISESLLRGDDTIGGWRERIRPALGDNAHILTEVIGELEVLIGPQAPVMDMATPLEQQARFKLAMQRLLNAMATPEQPVVLFLDDLQWADLSSLELITALAADPSSRHVLLVGAYRDNEVDGNHPLVETRERLRAGGRLDELLLGSLQEDAVLDLISDAFPGLSGRLRLASACHEKTGGNAFFLHRLLEALAEEELIRFDPDASRWTWDAVGVDGYEMPDQVVEFVAAEIWRMGEKAREALAVASCIADQFGLGTLAHVLGITTPEALDRIRAGLDAGLLDGTTKTDPTGNLVFRFSHDRVREAARQMIEADRRQQVHRQVGLFLLQNLGGSERERRLFEVVAHLNQGPPSMRTRAERVQLRRLNLDAAERALRSAAFEVAAACLRQAVDLVEPEGWTEDYRQTLSIHLSGARACYLVGDHEGMEVLVDRAVDNGRDVLDRVMAKEVKIQALLSQQRFLDALQLARDALGALDLVLPDNPTPDLIQTAVGDALARIQQMPEDQIASLPICEDEHTQARLRIQTGAMSSAYMAAPALLPILACNIVRSTLSDGVCEESPYGLAALGLVLNAVGHYQAAHAIGGVSKSMLERLGTRSIQPRTLHVLGAHVMLFVDPIRDWVVSEREVTRLGLDTGDLEYAAWGLHAEVCNGFYAGLPLDELAEAYARAMETLEHHQQHAAIGCTVQYGRAIACLRDGPEGAPGLSGPDFDEEAQHEAFCSVNFRGAVFVLGVMGAYVRYLFDDLEGAAAILDRAAPFADGAQATYHLVWHQQLRALVALGRVEPSDPQAVAETIERVGPDVDHLRLLAGVSPTNHGHREKLLDGELARVGGRVDDALSHFEAAADQASDNGFAHEAALAHERAAHCAAAAGRTELADAARGRAVDAWRRWGASAKADALASRDAPG